MQNDDADWAPSISEARNDAQMYAEFVQWVNASSLPPSLKIQFLGAVNDHAVGEKQANSPVSVLLRALFPSLDFAICPYAFAPGGKGSNNEIDWAVTIPIQVNTKPPPGVASLPRFASLLLFSVELKDPLRFSHQSARLEADKQMHDRFKYLHDRWSEDIAIRSALPQLTTLYGASFFGTRIKIYTFDFNTGHVRPVWCYAGTERMPDRFASPESEWNHHLFNDRTLLTLRAMVQHLYSQLSQCQVTLHDNAPHCPELDIHSNESRETLPGLRPVYTPYASDRPAGVNTHNPNDPSARLHEPSSSSASPASSGDLYTEGSPRTSSKKRPRPRISPDYLVFGGSSPLSSVPSKGSSPRDIEMASASPHGSSHSSGALQLSGLSRQSLADSHLPQEMGHNLDATTPSSNSSHRSQFWQQTAYQSEFISPLSGLNYDAALSNDVRTGSELPTSSYSALASSAVYSLNNDRLNTRHPSGMGTMEIDRWSSGVPLQQNSAQLSRFPSQTHSYSEDPYRTSAGTSGIRSQYGYSTAQSTSSNATPAKADNDYWEPNDGSPDGTPQAEISRTLAPDMLYKSDSPPTRAFQTSGSGPRQL